MFELSWRVFRVVMEREIPSFPADPRGRLLAGAVMYFDFNTGDLERHQLMDMPVLKDFTPSPQAYQAAIECYEIMRAHLSAIGIERQADLDMYTALVGGFVNQQLANDPHGDRWRVLLPRAITLFADDLGLPAGVST